MRSLRPLEAVFGASVFGSLLAVAVPAFVRNVHASRLSEPLQGLQKIGLAASEYAADKSVSQAYPADAPLTPALVPRGQSVEDDELIWQHPTWLALNFRMEGAHYFSFSFDSQNGQLTSSFLATAHGDLDGDGLFSQFELRGVAAPGKVPELFAIDIDREIE